MKIPGLGTLKTWGLAAFGLLSTALYALSLKRKVEVAELESEMAQRNATNAEMQKDQLQNAADAARIATAEGQEETKDAMEKADNDDYSGLNR